MFSRADFTTVNRKDRFEVISFYFQFLLILLGEGKWRMKS